MESFYLDISIMDSYILAMQGEELRTIRKQLGLTQVGFAEELGLHWNTLARLERGEVTITRMVEKFARLLLQLAEATKGKKKRKKQKRSQK